MKRVFYAPMRSGRSGYLSRITGQAGNEVSGLFLYFAFHFAHCVNFRHRYNAFPALSNVVKLPCYVKAGTCALLYAS